MYINLVRWWLMGMLFFMPFQHMIIKSSKVWDKELLTFIRYYDETFIRYFDEITVVIFVPLAIREVYKNREVLVRFYLILLSPIFVLSISGLISGIINENSLYITILGIFDYIKIFLFIFIYAAFFREFSEFKKIFRLLLIVAVFLGVLAFIQEIWALSSRYVLEKDINDMGTYFLHNIPLALHNNNIGDHWRFGIYRAPSLVGHYNLLGLYSLFILTIYLCVKKKVNFAVVASLLTGVFLSISRMVYTGFVFVAGIQIFRGRKWFVALVVIPMVILVFYMGSSLLPALNVIELTNEGYLAKEIPYRVYARDKTIEVWKDHPFWGVGPGMFGGVVSVMYRSPLYKEYNFLAMPLLKHYKSLDQFWPQVLAEMGIAGTTAFACLFISWFITFFMLRQRSTSEEMRGLFAGLAIFTIIILIWSLGGGVKNAVIFTYSAFAGMGLGCINKHRNNK